MNSWPVKKLGEIIELHYGKGIPKHDRKVNGKYPIYGANGELGRSDKYLTEGEAIIVGRKGSAGEVTRVSGKFWPSDVTYYVFGNHQIDIDYLFYLLKEIDLKRLATGVKPGINRNKVYEIEVPVPPIDEQKKIVAKLEKIFKPQRFVDEQLNNVEALFNSVCLTAFSKIQGEFKEITLDEVSEVVKGKFPTLKTREGIYPFVVTARARRTANDFQFDGTAVCIPLVSSTGHGHADIKRIHYEEGKFALANIMAALISKDENRLLPKYLYYHLSFYKDELLVPLMSGSANVTIPINSLKYVKIPLPSISLQFEVINKLSKIEELKGNLIERKKLLEELQRSILHQAFQGEL